MCKESSSLPLSLRSHTSPFKQQAFICIANNLANHNIQMTVPLEPLIFFGSKHSRNDDTLCWDCTCISFGPTNTFIIDIFYSARLVCTPFSNLNRGNDAQISFGLCMETSLKLSSWQAVVCTDSLSTHGFGLRVSNQLELPKPES